MNQHTIFGDQNRAYTAFEHETILREKEYTAKKDADKLSKLSALLRKAFVSESHTTYGALLNTHGRG